MAGTLAVIPVRDKEKHVTAIREQWEVQYSRFFSYPAPTASTCPDLVPMPQFLRNRGSLGTWITSSSPALLRLVLVLSGSGVVLTVCCGGRLQEEHYVSKLNFSWPQVSCISGFPARGTRAVFVSYIDSVGEIQKFALRFSATGETEKFINTLKDILKGGSDTKPLSSGLVSAISSPSEYTSSNRPLCRASNDLSAMNPVMDYTPVLPTSSNYKEEQPSFTQQTTPVAKFQSNSAAFPPSFTSLLTDYCPMTDQVAAYSTVSEEVALRSQIAKYMEDSSFQGMLYGIALK